MRMKKISTTAIFIFCLSCGNKNVRENKNDSAENKSTSYCYQPGIVNCLDENGKRQGLWIITGAMEKKSAYADTARVKEGHYINDKKVGQWYEFEPNGSIKTQLTYKNGEVLK